jgi:hypothetical protein
MNNELGGGGSVEEAVELRCKVLSQNMPTTTEETPLVRVIGLRAECERGLLTTRPRSYTYYAEFST